MPSHFPGGITNATGKESLFWKLGVPDPTIWHTYWNDFNDFRSGEWNTNIVELGAGSATNVIDNADGGVLLITNDDADNDYWFAQTGETGAPATNTSENFLFSQGKQLFFKARWKVSDATQSDVIMGLQLSSNVFGGTTSGVSFVKADGATALTLDVDNVAVQTASLTGAVIADDTWVETSFRFDGDNRLRVYVDDVEFGTDNLAEFADLPTTELSVSFGIRNGEAVAKTMSVDYIFVAKER